MRQQLFVSSGGATTFAMTPGPELQAALHAAYEVFAAYRRPGRLEAAPTRDPDAILAELTSAPLRELSADRIGYYAGKAMTTVSDDRNYRHFLPRLLELAALGDCGDVGTDPEGLARKIVYGDFHTWPRDERAAVVGVFEAAARQAIGEALDQATPEPWLIGLGELGVSASPLLQLWLAADSLDAGLHLVEAVRSEAYAARRGDEVQSAPEAQAVRLWLRGPTVRERLETLLRKVPEDEIWRVEAALIESAAFD
jgi:hypothetical protein